MTGVFSLFVVVLPDIIEDFEINFSNRRKEISANKNVRFKKMNNKHMFLPLIKSLIAPPENFVLMITQVYAKSKLWMHSNLQQPQFLLFFHLRYVYTYDYIVYIYEPSIKTSTKCKSYSAKKLKHLVYKTGRFQKTFKGS